MDLSFVILTWNSVAYLEKCLASIRAALQGAPVSYEVLVLDNGSHDGTPALLAELAQLDPERVRPFFEDTNTGTTRSRNRLLAAARGNHVCVMDSDVELAPGVVETLMGVLQQDRNMGIVAPCIRYPSGAWQKSFDHFPTLLDKVNRYFRLRQIEKQQGAGIEAATEPFPIDYAISAFWLMRREILATVGMLDERIFYAPEDTDFCLRVWQAGFRIYYVPGVCVVHHTQEISRGLKLNRAKLSHMKGLLYYFRKHRYILRRPRFPAGSQGIGPQLADPGGTSTWTDSKEHRST